MSGSFEDILNTPSESVEAPKPIPAGQWLAVVDGPHETGESKAKKTPYIRFKFKLLEPHGEISAEDDEIAKARGRSITNDIYFSETNQDLAKHQLNQFLLACGIDQRGKTVGQMMSEAPGSQIIVNVEHELTQPTDGSEPQLIARARRFGKV